jgi:hypothetical protein
MQTEYVISLEEYLHANRLWARNEVLRYRTCYWFRSWPAVVLGVLFILSVIFLKWFETSSKALAVATLIIGLILILQPYGYRQTMRKSYDRNKMALPVRVNVTDACLEIALANGNADSRLAWPLFEKYIESESLFQLVFRRASFVLIPKRALTPDQQSELRALLASHIPSK